jgi:hypothetical protein
MIVKYVATIEESTGRILNVEFPQATLKPEGTTDGLTVVHVTEERMTDNFMGMGWNPSHYFWDGSKFCHVGQPPNRHAIYNGTDWEWDSEAMMLDIKAMRNNRLKACDWTQMPDAPLTEEQKSAWQAYRQELRDFPSTLTNPSSLDELVWPVSPA